MSATVSKTRLKNFRSELRAILANGADYNGLDDCDLAGLDVELRNLSTVTNSVLYYRDFCPELRLSRLTKILPEHASHD